MTEDKGVSGEQYLEVKGGHGPSASSSSQELSNSETVKPGQKWPLKTLIEILPIIIALTAIFSYSTMAPSGPPQGGKEVALVTPLEQVLGGVPLWVAGLMGLVAVSGTLGMVWLIYIFSRAPVAPDGSSEE